MAQTAAGRIGQVAYTQGNTVTPTTGPSTEMKGGSMQLAHAITFDEHRLVSLWHRLVTTLGIHTARVLLARGPGSGGHEARPRAQEQVQPPCWGEHGGWTRAIRGGTLMWRDRRPGVR